MLPPPPLMSNRVKKFSEIEKWKNSDLHETREMIYHLKGNDESVPKM